MKLALLIAACALLVTGSAGARAASPAVLTFKATQSGRQTLDQGEGGGNPFASALIQVLSEQRPLGGFPARIRELTAALSEGFQQADVPQAASPSELAVAGAAPGRKVSLVLVYSDYSTAPGLPSLPGAARDARRIAEALERAGYETEVVVDPSRPALARILGDFTAKSTAASVALLYTTGHGVEVDGIGYLIPNDYPVYEGAEALPDSAVPLSRLSSTLRAGTANLFFYGGCRDNPFAG